MRHAIGALMILELVVLGFGTVQAESTLAEADALFNEQGIAMSDRYFALSSRDYNGMAADLAAKGFTVTLYNRTAERINEIAAVALKGLDIRSGHRRPIRQRDIAQQPAHRAKAAALVERHGCVVALDHFQDHRALAARLCLLD